MLTYVLMFFFSIYPPISLTASIPGACVIAGAVLRSRSDPAFDIQVEPAEDAGDDGHLPKSSE